MTILKLKILQKVHQSSPSDPVYKGDFLKRNKVLIYNRAINELVSAGLMKYKGNSEILLLTPSGIHELENWASVMRDHWITRSLSVVAIIISIISLLLK